MFNLVESRQVIVVLFEDGRAGELVAAGFGGGLGHDPAGLGHLGAGQDEGGSFEKDGGGGAGLIEDGEEGCEGGVGEVVEAVAAGEEEIGAGAADGGGKLFTMDTELSGGIGEGASGG